MKPRLCVFLKSNSLNPATWYTVLIAFSGVDRRTRRQVGWTQSNTFGHNYLWGCPHEHFEQKWLSNACLRSQNGAGVTEIWWLKVRWGCFACKRVGRSWEQPWAHGFCSAFIFRHVHLMAVAALNHVIPYWHYKRQSWKLLLWGARAHSAATVGKVRLHHYICFKGHLSGSLEKAWNYTWLNKRNRS